MVNKKPMIYNLSPPLINARTLWKHLNYSWIHCTDHKVLIKVCHCSRLLHLDTDGCHKIISILKNFDTMLSFIYLTQTRIPSAGGALGNWRGWKLGMALSGANIVGLKPLSPPPGSGPVTNRNLSSFKIIIFIERNSQSWICKYN